MNRNQTKAFTLVELIVVITILAILGTIAFLSLQWYSQDARDSSRVSDINNIQTSLELFSLKTGKYPLPDNAQDVTYSGGTITLWNQGSIGESVTQQLSRQLNEKPTDPLYETEYVYSTLDNRSQYEVMSVYESLAQTPLLNTSYAVTPSSVKIDGTYNGLYIKNGNYIVPTPSIITAEALPLDFNGTSIASQVIDGGTNIPNIWTTIAQSTGALSFSTFEVYQGTLQKDSDESEFLAAYNAIANTYSGSSLQNNADVQTFLSQTSDEAKVALTKTVVLNTPSNTNTSTANETNYSCTGTVPTSNVVTSNDTWLTADTAWQNSNSWNDCYYECTGWYTWANCDIEPALITSTDCTNAWWMWVSNANDVYIGSSQGNGFCISPRVWDFAWDSTWNGISFNGWGDYSGNTNYQWWTVDSIDDTGNNNSDYGQTRDLNPYWSWDCKAIWTSTSDFIGSDTILWRMQWLAMNKNNLTELQHIEWADILTPPNWHSTPAIYIADCIDWVKDLGTTMTYTHNNNTTDEVTYAEYSTDVSLDTETPYLSDTTYQNRQKYLTAWTQKTGSHLPSAFSYINDDNAWPCTGWWDCDNLSTATTKWEYQVACEANLFTDANDDMDNERIWTSAIGYTAGTIWGRSARVVGYSGCGDQSSSDTGNRYGYKSARFVVRP